MAAWRNWMAKHQVVLCRNWLAQGEGVPAWRPGARTGQGGPARRHRGPMKEDDTLWHGWYRRHGGEFDLIGDHFGGSDATSVLLVLAAMGLLWKMAQQAPQFSVAAAEKPKSSRSRRKR